MAQTTGVAGAFRLDPLGEYYTSMLRGDPTKCLQMQFLVKATEDVVKAATAAAEKHFAEMGILLGFGIRRPPGGATRCKRDNKALQERVDMITDYDHGSSNNGLYTEVVAGLFCPDVSWVTSFRDAILNDALMSVMYPRE
jgi:hypothetical protein